MKVLNDYLLVEFIDDKSIKELPNGKQLIIPTRSIFQQDTGKNEGTLTQQVLDRRLINPQIAVVVEENKTVDHITGKRRFPDFKKGTIVYTHYGAWDTSRPYTHLEASCDFISANTILFTTDETKSLIEPVNGVYVGELADEEPEQTKSGLWIPETCRENVVDRCRIKLLHVPKGDKIHTAGEVVRTIDDKHYTFDFNNRKYIMVKQDFIIGTYVN